MYFYTIFNGFLIFKLYVGSYEIQVIKVLSLCFRKRMILYYDYCCNYYDILYETSFRKFRYNFHLVLCSDIIQE